ncbi:MAG: hypothetical protein P8Q50_15165 [Octadecabacter sp.]|nr:hypothetical protein [Octadecabacter sp.]
MSFPLSQQWGDKVSINDDEGSDLTYYQEQFGGAFSQEEAEAVVAGFNGDVSRAASLYKNLTDGYVSHMTVEALIKAGKE